MSENEDLSGSLEDDGDFFLSPRLPPVASSSALAPGTIAMPQRQLRFSGLSAPGEAADADAPSTNADEAVEEGGAEEEVEGSGAVEDAPAPLAAAPADAACDGTEQELPAQAASSSAEMQVESAAPATTAAAAKADDSNYIKAYLRVRPLTGIEVADGATETITLQDKSTVLLRAPVGSHAHSNAVGQKEHVASYSTVFDKSASQRHLFEATVAPTILRAVEEGANGLVFAYGMTNAGKTYTISGKGGAESEGAGILPRALDSLLDCTSQWNARETLRAGDKVAQLVISVTYVEIYNENTYDLLRSGGGGGEGSGGGQAVAPSRPAAAFAGTLRGGSAAPAGVNSGKTGLEITTVGPPHVKGAKQWLIPTKRAATAVLSHGADNKTHAATALNSDSSRSHAVFNITIFKRDASLAGPLPSSPDALPLDIVTDSKPFYAVGYTPHARLTIVDLAGSESAKRTGAAGQALKEAGNINKSLMFLQQCFQSLREAAAKGSVAKPPYRSCQLTLLLRDSLQGSAAGDIIMIVCAGPGNKDYDETRKAVEWGALMKETRVVRVKALSKWAESEGVDANGRRIGKDGKLLVPRNTAAGAAAGGKGGSALLRGDSTASGLSAATGGPSLNSTAGSTVSGLGGGMAVGGGAGTKRPRTETSETDASTSAAMAVAESMLIADLRGEVERLRGELEAASAEVSSANALKNNAEATAAEQQQACAELQDELERATGELEEALSRAAALQHRAGEVEAELNSAKDELFDAHESVSSFNRMVRQLEDSLEDKEEALEAQEAEIRAEMADEFFARETEKEAAFKARQEKRDADVANKLAKLLTLLEARGGAALGAGLGKSSKAGKAKAGKGVSVEEDPSSSTAGAAFARAAITALMAQVGLPLPGASARGPTTLASTGAHAMEEEEEGDGARAPTRHAPSAPRLSTRPLARGRSTMSSGTLGGGSEAGRSSLMDEGEADVEALRQEVATLQENLQEVEDELNRKTDELKSLSKTSTALGSEVSDLRTSAASLSLHKERLEVELEEARHSAASAAEATIDARAEAAYLAGAVHDAQAQVEAYASKAAKLQADLIRAQAERDAALARSSEAEAGFKDSAASIDSYRSKVTELQGRLTNLTASVEPLRARTEAAEQAEAKARSQADAAQREAASLRSTGAEPMVRAAELVAVQARVAALQGEVQGLTAQLQGRAVEMQGLKEAMSALQSATLAQVEGVKEAAAVQHKQDQAWIDAFAPEKARLTTANATLQDDVNALQARVVGLEADAAELRKVAGTGRDEALAAKATIAALQAQLVAAAATEPAMQDPLPESSGSGLFGSSFALFAASQQAKHAAVAAPREDAAGEEEEEEGGAPSSGPALVRGARAGSRGRGAGSKRGRPGSSRAASNSRAPVAGAPTGVAESGGDEAQPAVKRQKVAKGRGVPVKAAPNPMASPDSVYIVPSAEKAPVPAPLPTRALPKRAAAAGPASKPAVPSSTSGAPSSRMPAGSSGATPGRAAPRAPVSSTAGPLGSPSAARFAPGRLAFAFGSRIAAAAEPASSAAVAGPTGASAPAAGSRVGRKAPAAAASASLPAQAVKVGAGEGRRRSLLARSEPDDDEDINEDGEAGGAQDDVQSVTSDDASMDEEEGEGSDGEEEEEEIVELKDGEWEDAGENEAKPAAPTTAAGSRLPLVDQSTSGATNRGAAGGKSRRGGAVPPPLPAPAASTARAARAASRRK